MLRFYFIYMFKVIKFYSKVCYKMTEFDRKNKLGVMLVGMGGNNGSTLIAGLLAHSKGITWSSKAGTEHKVEWLGSVSQYGNTPDTDGTPIPLKDLAGLYDPEDIIVGGWDICSDNMYQAAQKARVLDHALIEQIKDELSSITPLQGVYRPGWIASNQTDRVNNSLSQDLSHEDIISHLRAHINNFKTINGVDKVVVMWTASTERNSECTWFNMGDLCEAIQDNDPEVSPSTLFALASMMEGCIFLNGSAQNTIGPAIIDYAKHYNVYVGGEDFKTGQTKLKSALVDWLVMGGIRPLAVTSYNHLGNNDGLNLKERAQFQSKETSKKGVIDDVISENPQLFTNNKRPDHTVVIEYVPSVGDSKRAMDEYYSELAFGGKMCMAIHTTCEDSLLAVPLMLDLILFSEYFSREPPGDKSPLLTQLSLFFKAPVGTSVNAFFRQRYALENILRTENELPPIEHTI